MEGFQILLKKSHLHFNLQFQLRQLRI